MEERSSTDSEKMEEIMLPGFRFHPTDEELVGFYLKRKIQQRPLSIELIKQLDIYKYDPWDLPKLATTGEKEWYFYCPRDRKYRNSARPNRVTGAGFWKATGTDRPIYSSEGNKCIGLKKSLVFYKGRAAKGVKTDWMMHEFRLPSLTDSSNSSAPPKRFLDKALPTNDSWAICRIFKKTNSTAQRALSQSWVSPIPETSSISELSSDNLTANTSSHSQSVQFNLNPNPTTDNINISTTAAFSPLDFLPFKHLPPQLPTMSSCGDLTSLIFAPLDHQTSSSSSSTSSSSKLDVTSMLINMSSSMLGDYQSCNGFISAGSGTTLPHHHHDEMIMQGNMNVMMSHVDHDHDQWEAVRSIGSCPLIGMPAMSMGDIAWKPSMMPPWDASCPSEMSTSFSTTTKCYT